MICGSALTLGASEPHLYSKDDLFHGNLNIMPLLHCLKTSTNLKVCILAIIRFKTKQLFSRTDIIFYFKSFLAACNDHTNGWLEIEFFANSYLTTIYM